MRIFAIAEAFERGYTIDRLYELTKIAPWFLEKLQNIYNFKVRLESYNRIEDLPADVLAEAKRLGFSDFQIAASSRTPRATSKPKAYACATCVRKTAYSPR